MTSYLPTKLVTKLAFICLCVSLCSMQGIAQTSVQNFGTGTFSQTSQTGSAATIPAPTGSGTTWARAGATAPNAPVVGSTTSNPLGTTGTYVRAAASTSTSVCKFSPWVGYTASTEFYTSFKVLFGDASAGSTATAGSWNFYQGAGAMYSDASDFSGAQVFTGLRFTFGAGGAITLTYRGGSAFTNTGLTTTSFSSATVYTVEIVGNNKSSGTINYTYNGNARSVAVQKFDLYINGTLIGDDLAEALLPANTNVVSGTFIGISSASNAANVFVDDAVVYNAVPANIGTSKPNPPTVGTVTIAASSQTATVPFTQPGFDGNSAITSYTATSSPGGLTGTVNQAGSGNILVAGLSYGTAYTFTVTATNAIGTSDPSLASNSITPYTVPDAPTIGTAVAGNGEATVSFTAPTFNGGSVITSYTATSNPGGFTSTINQAGSGSITVTGLTNGTPYTFTVTATNAAGESLASGSSNNVTPAATTAPGAPGIGTVTPGNGQVTVDFTAPVSDGGDPITSYTATSNPGGFTGTINQAGSGSVVVTGLTNGVAYTFTVTATNSIGTSAASNPSASATPFTVPDAPTIGTATPGNGQATVSFTAPAFNGGSVITSYTATSNPDGFTGTVNQAGSGSITVTGLTNGTPYTFTVTATNAAGTSAASNASNSITPAQVPDAPTIGTVTAGNAQATVPFTAPAFDGGAAITSYTATSSPGGFTGTINQAGSGSITVTGLANGTAYTFTVTATNAIGTSAASSASNSVTPSTVPGAPTIGTAVPGDQQALVPFTAPASNGGSVITSYTATSNPGGFTGTINQAGSGSILVSGLTNGTPYTFTVVATNANGNSAASAASNSVTPVELVQPGEVLINQMSSAYSGASDEYVEIVNTTNKTINLSQLRLSYRAAAGTGSNDNTLSGTLLPHSFWLLSPNATITTGSTSGLTRDGSFNAGFAATSGQIALIRIIDGAKIDGLGYGTITGGTYTETSSSVSPPTNGGLRRVTDGADNNTNNTDFTTVANASIYLRNSSSRLANSGASIAAGTYSNISVTGNSSIAGNVTVSSRLSTTAGEFSIGANTLTLNGTVISGAGTLAGSATSNLTIGGSGALGTLSFSQLTDGTSNAINDFVVNRTSSGTLSLGNKLVLLGTYTPTAGTLTTGGFLHLSSTSSGTARIATGDNAGGYITGNVTVERYIPNNGFRSWRLLSVPTFGNGQSINQAWQEGQAPLAIPAAPYQNYGTQITGPGGANGLDAAAPKASMLYWSGTGWADITNTTSTGIASKDGYFIYVRGDRSKGLTGLNTNSSATTLRTTGSLYQGTHTSNTVLAGQFGSIGNLYASAVNFTGLTLNDGIAGNTYFYIWDSKRINGTSLGSYQLFSSSDGYRCNLSGGSYVLNSLGNTTIESGQAFLVKATGTSGSVTFNESAKIASTPGLLGLRPLTPSAPVSSLSNRLYSVNNNNMEDAVVVVFNTTYSNSIASEDAPKLSNPGETFAIAKADKFLGIEGRQPITGTDTLFFGMWNLRQQEYRLEFVPENIVNNGVIALLKDKYLGTSTVVNLDAATSVNFTVDANQASAAKDRFMIVFTTARPLPICCFTSVAANRINGAIKVNWTVAAERDIRQYVVERSADGRNFGVAGTVNATGNNSLEMQYNFTDAAAVAGNVFYRVKSIGFAGDIRYTSVVKVGTGGTKAGFTVSPNPVEGAVVNLQFKNQVAGEYKVRLTNMAGQSIFNIVINHAGGNSTQLLSIPSAAKGSYQLEIIAPDNSKSAQQVLVSK